MNNLNKKLSKFLNKEKSQEEDQEKVFINERDGLIERVDKKYVTKNGKQLLREVMYD